MYRYIVDIRYPKGIESEDSCIVHNMFKTCYEDKIKILYNNHEHTELLIEFKTIKEADELGLKLNNLKSSISSECTIDCYIVTGKWRV